MELVNKLINDNKQSPSEYHSNTVVKSNIPSTSHKENKPMPVRQSQTLTRTEGMPVMVCHHLI